MAVESLKIPKPSAYVINTQSPETLNYSICAQSQLVEGFPGLASSG
jgi:hypothetical protein